MKNHSSWTQKLRTMTPPEDIKTCCAFLLWENKDPCSSFNSLAANGALIHCHLKAQTPYRLLCTAPRRWCHLVSHSVRRNGEARRRVVSVGETLAAFRECGGLPQTEERLGQALSCRAAQALPRSFPRWRKPSISAGTLRKHQNKADPPAAGFSRDKNKW